MQGTYIDPRGVARHWRAQVKDNRVAISAGTADVTFRLDHPPTEAEVAVLAKQWLDAACKNDVT